MYNMRIPKKREIPPSGTKKIPTTAPSATAFLI